MAIRTWAAHKGESNAKRYLAVDAHGVPVSMFVTTGTVVAACRLADVLKEERMNIF